MDYKEYPRGKMRAEWRVLCGKCGYNEWLDEYEVSQLGGLGNVAKSKGWRYTRSHGWTCPSCVSSTQARASSGPGETCGASLDWRDTRG